jgi:hypothetical protein
MRHFAAADPFQRPRVPRPLLMLERAQTNPDPDLGYMFSLGAGNVFNLAQPGNRATQSSRVYLPKAPKQNARGPRE